ncbi:hypothetical protein MNBD_GAMMA23-552 [hydrothermal vent metagenome]|uniref:Uncharacterized protein n=1 Tax=hydrothermal vent metagenome TaxID=652676 RepID=A0A3B1A7P4_9ZZZZ
MKFCRVAATLDLKISQQDLEKHLPASPYVVGEEIAEQAIVYEEQQHLSYYPAVEFLKEQHAIDQDLVNAIENISWLVSNLIREEITRRLRPVFSTVQFENIQLHAFKMPTVRPHNKNARHELAAHYTPDHAHVSIITTSIKHYDDAVTAERMTKNLIHRWLNDHVDGLEITSVSYIES